MSTVQARAVMKVGSKAARSVQPTVDAMADMTDRVKAEMMAE